MEKTSLKPNVPYYSDSVAMHQLQHKAYMTINTKTKAEKTNDLCQLYQEGQAQGDFISVDFKPQHLDCTSLSIKWETTETSK